MIILVNFLNLLIVLLKLIIQFITGIKINIKKNYYINLVNQRIKFYSKFDLKKWNLKFSEQKDPIFLIGFPSLWYNTIRYNFKNS